MVKRAHRTFICAHLQSEVTLLLVLPCVLTSRIERHFQRAWREESHAIVQRPDLANDQQFDFKLDFF